MTTKILGQLSVDGTVQALYTVPAGKMAVISSMVVTQLGAEAVFTAYATKSGQAASQAAVVVNQSLVSLARLSVSEGWTLAAGEAIRVVSSGVMSVTIFGNEVAAT